MEIVHLPGLKLFVPCAVCGRSPCQWVKRPTNQPYYASFSLYPAEYQPVGQVTFVESAQPHNTHYCSEECSLSLKKVRSNAAEELKQFSDHLE